MGQRSEPESIPCWPGQPCPLLQAALSGMRCQKKGRGSYLIGYQYTEGTQIEEWCGTHMKPCGKGQPGHWFVCRPNAVWRQNNVEVSSWETERSVCQKQKLRRDYFKCYSSLTLYQLLNLQIDVKLISSLNLEAFVFIHSILSGEQEALCQSHACVFIFVSLLRREALTNLGTRVKKSKIITTSNNRIAICSVQALQSAISFNPQDNLVRLVLLPPLCRGGNSG